MQCMLIWHAQQYSKVCTLLMYKIHSSFFYLQHSSFASYMTRSRKHDEAKCLRNCHGDSPQAHVCMTGATEAKSSLHALNV
jgi:hypothetical protein